MTWDQWIILITAVAIFMAQSGRPKLAAYIALAVTPAWLWASWSAEQYGVFVVSIVCAFAWARGLVTVK